MVVAKDSIWIVPALFLAFSRLIFWISVLLTLKCGCGKPRTGDGETFFSKLPTSPAIIKPKISLADFRSYKDCISPDKSFTKFLFSSQKQIIMINISISRVWVLFLTHDIETSGLSSQGQTTCLKRGEHFEYNGARVWVSGARACALCGESRRSRGACLLAELGNTKLRSWEL